ncbi:MAG: lycopene cyclase family protein [Actinomycetota bacterium]
MSEPDCDLLVVGAGPAGLGLAAACADLGLRVHVVAPRPETPWRPTYGLWLDEAREAGLAQALAHAWPRTVVRTGAAAQHTLARGYGLLDNAAAQATLTARIRAAGGGLVEGVVAGADDGRVTLRDGRTITAAVVADASGHAPVLAPRPQPAGFQSAFGVELTLEEPPGAEGAMTLMDFRDGGSPAPPTFLYAMDLGAGRWFVEETSLVAREPLGFPALEARLRRRLGLRDRWPSTPRMVERCVFPMGAPIAARPPGAFAFGAAASMVHPASGYQVGPSLVRAPVIAAAVAEARRRDLPPDDAAALAWSRLWSRDRRRQHALHRLGAAVLLDLGLDDLQAFFAAFFTMPEGRWRAYLGDARGVGDVERAMLDLYARVSPRLRWRLTRAAVGPARRELAVGLGLLEDASSHRA